MKRSTAVPCVRLERRVNKILRTLLPAAVLTYLCSIHFCFGQDEVRSDTHVQNILTEAARLAAQVENLRDRMLVCVKIGLANHKSGDSVSAKLNFEEALKLIDNFSPQERFADFYRQSIAEAQAEMGDTEGADRTLGRIKDDSQRSEGFRTVGHLQAQRGDFKGAILKAPFIDDPENREEFLKSISQMQLEANTPHDSQDSEESFDADDSCADIAAADTINVPEDKARCLAYWGGRLATEGQFSTALEILRRAHQESSLVLDMVVRAYTLKEIARGQAKADSMGDASQSLAEAETLALAEYKIRRGWTSIPRELVELTPFWRRSRKATK